MAREKVFISYSHKDKAWLEKLRVQLRPVESAIDVWDDTRIQPGQKWLEALREALASARVGVLLVSPDFLASRFITHEEVPTLLKAAESEGLCLLPVFLRPSMVDETTYFYRDATGGECSFRLTELQGVNDPGQPLSKLKGAAREEALVAVAKALLKAAGAPVSGPGPSPRKALARVDVRPYLEWLREQTRWLDIRGLGAMVTERTELDRVYTRLRVTGPSAEGERSKAGRKGLERKAEGPLEGARARDSELKDLLGLHPQLVLVGDPGAGKTTFLRFVAHNVAKAGLGEQRDESLARVGLSGEPPFPVVVRLGDLGQYLADHPDPEHPADSPEHLYRFLDFPLKGLQLGLPEGHLRQRVLGGGCLLLLDGLDEVPGKAMRERVGRVLDAAVGAGRGRNRHLVTCRTRAYQGKAQLGESFTRANLVDFGPAEVEAFVTQWSWALRHVAPGDRGPAAAEAARYAEELLGEIRAHPHALPLTANPLMLTILAVVHWNRRKLPEQRADLYDAAIQYLLESRKGQSPYTTPVRRECLQAIAIRMFQDRAVRKTLDRAEAAEAVRPRPLNVDLRRALEFVEDEELHSGILVSRREGEVEFWHPTFGEYLAAASLSLEPAYWARLRKHVFDDRWSEVVLLLAGCRRRYGLKFAADLIQKILAADKTPVGRARAVGLVGRILRDILPYGEDPSQGTGYAKALKETLALFEKGSQKVPESVRVEVGEALGQAGDPRLGDDDHANRVFIRGGTFWMGAQKADKKKPAYDEEAWDDEAPAHRVAVSGFWIDRHPVTVQQFRRFVDAGSDGYLDEGFWSREGWAWRRSVPRAQPGEWEEQTRHPNRPVVNVTWYEADAYCRWLARETGRPVQLPTEAQWEFAARGEEGRKYPWGKAAPTDQHANFHMNVGHATPVGIYPQGATPEGVEDMAGNVWEWCRDWFGLYSPDEPQDPTGPAGGESHLLRGGGFYDDPRGLRAACRVFDPRERVDVDVGFRCVVVGAGEQQD